MWQLKILMSIVLNKFHHAATQDPGHSTKIVTLPFHYIVMLDRSLYVWQYVIVIV